MRVPGVDFLVGRTIYIRLSGHDPSVDRINEIIGNGVAELAMRPSSGGFYYDGVCIEVPEQGRFYPLCFGGTCEVDIWFVFLTEAARLAGESTAQIADGNLVLSSGSTFPLASCRVGEWAEYPGRKRGKGRVS